MKQAEIAAAIGKTVVVNPRGDIGMDVGIRRIIGKDSTLIKQCKNGKLEVEHERRRYSVPMTNVDIKKEEPAVEDEQQRPPYGTGIFLLVDEDGNLVDRTNKE